MITVQEAERSIAARITTMPVERVAVDRAVGRILRETIVAQRDQPPFDRAMMDGIAIAAADDSNTYRLVGETAAGQAAGRLTKKGECIEIMTGAPMPAGGNCVVPVECLTTEGASVRLRAEAVREPGRFVHPRASDHGAGAELLTPGTVLGATRIAVAVSAGRPHIDVSRLPRIAIGATGDELVDVDAPVEPHQIRRSNDYALAALLTARGFADCRRYHVGDDVSAQTREIGRALEDADVLVLTGGVSMGRHDHVAEVLHALGVELVFHRVSQKPGKPMWFGVGAQGQPVFALPGNPVSALVNVRRYVIPALDLMVARRTAADSARARLAEAYRFAPALTCFVPSTSAFDADGHLLATPQPVNTSGDLTALAATDGFLELNLEHVDFEAGHTASWYAW